MLNNRYLKLFAAVLIIPVLAFAFFKVEEAEIRARSMKAVEREAAEYSRTQETHSSSVEEAQRKIHDTNAALAKTEKQRAADQLSPQTLQAMNLTVLLALLAIAVAILVLLRKRA